MVTWTKLPALTSESAGLRSGCLHCGPIAVTADMNMVIAVGFGSATVTRGAETVYSEQDLDDEQGMWTVQDAEDAALLNPDHDWRIRLHGPLSSAEYQRHGADTWVLVARGEGFA